MNRNSNQWIFILGILLFLSGGLNVYLQLQSRDAICQLNKEKLKMDSVLSVKLQTDYALFLLRDSLQKKNGKSGLVNSKNESAPAPALR